MAKSNAQILADIRTEQPQLSGVADARITAFLVEARSVWVPVSRLSGDRLDSALKYKALELLQISLSSSASGSTGSVKREKTRNVEREYFDSSAAASAFFSQDFAGLYKKLVGLAALGPWVLNGD